MWLTWVYISVVGLWPNIREHREQGMCLIIFLSGTSVWSHHLPLIVTYRNEWTDLLILIQLMLRTDTEWCGHLCDEAFSLAIFNGQIWGTKCGCTLISEHWYILTRFLWMWWWWSHCALRKSIKVFCRVDPLNQDLMLCLWFVRNYYSLSSLLLLVKRYGLCDTSRIFVAFVTFLISCIQLRAGFEIILVVLLTHAKSIYVQAYAFIYIERLIPTYKTV